MLTLANFGVAYGNRVAVADASFSADVGITILMGPPGSGKSTLLRTLAGLNQADPTLRIWGSATVDGLSFEDRRPALIQQRSRVLASTLHEALASALPNRSTTSRREQAEHLSILLQRRQFADGSDEARRMLQSEVTALDLGRQRRILLLREELRSERTPLMIDELCSGLSDEDAAAISVDVRAAAERRAVVLVTHHKARALALGGSCVLLAGGRTIEQGRTLGFFSAASTETGRRFASTGTCAVAGPNATASELAPGIQLLPLPPQAAAARNAPAARHPQGFYWLHRGRLAGMPRPGLHDELSRDLEALRSLGITSIVCLEETAMHLPADCGIRVHWSPTKDMGAPSHSEAVALCTRLDQLLADGEAVALHCRAGMGRTGTALAMHLVWHGASSADALAHVRGIYSRFVQSDTQVLFLEEFSRAARGTGAHGAAPTPPEKKDTHVTR